MRIRIVICLLFIAGYASGQLPLRLPSILSDHAVMQQDASVKVWGWGPGSMTVAIVCSWAPHDTVFAQIGADCEWQATIKTPKAGKPYAIEFRCGQQKITLQDIVLGEVWLCSGQSNMEFNMKWGITDAGDFQSNCRNNQIRFFQVKQAYDKFPQTNCDGEWVICDENSAASFSSVGYFFGRRLNERMNVPVGLIGSYWGGTGIQTWMPSEVFQENPQLQKFTKNIEAYGWAPKGATLLYNAMIYPLTAYRISGVIWYQGEANVATEHSDYSELFMAMISSWRKAFANDFPIEFVQIAPCSYYQGINAAYLREQQEMALKLPKTGMVSVADLVDDVSNIHPGKKRMVGERLANLALVSQYGLLDLQPYSPSFERMTIRSGEVIITVKSVGSLSCGKIDVENFQIAGRNRHFYSGKASISDDGTIRVHAPEVKKPVAVRYCFTNDAIPGIFDTNGLPLLPFRTDNW